MNANLISTCHLFLIPASILFGALGVAGTEQLKTLVSFMGLATSVVWVVRLHLMENLPRVDIITALTLAYIFVVAWVVALIAHAVRWSQGA